MDCNFAWFHFYHWHQKNKCMSVYVWSIYFSSYFMFSVSIALIYKQMSWQECFNPMYTSGIIMKPVKCNVLNGSENLGNFNSRSHQCIHTSQNEQIATTLCSRTKTKSISKPKKKKTYIKDEVSEHCIEWTLIDNNHCIEQSTVRAYYFSKRYSNILATRHYMPNTLATVAKTKDNEK